MTKLERNKRISILYPIWMSGFDLEKSGYLFFAKGSSEKHSREKDLSIAFKESISHERAKDIFEKMAETISAVCISKNGKEVISIPISIFSVEKTCLCLSKYKTVNFCLLTSESFQCEDEGELMFHFEFKGSATISDVQTMKDCLKASVKNVHYISIDIPKE